VFVVVVVANANATSDAQSYVAECAMSKRADVQRHGSIPSRVISRHDVEGMIMIRIDE
jgi:hypothetical protein